MAATGRPPTATRTAASRLHAGGILVAGRADRATAKRVSEMCRQMNAKNPRRHWVTFTRDGLVHVRRDR